MAAAEPTSSPRWRQTAPRRHWVVISGVVAAALVVAVTEALLTTAARSAPNSPAEASVVADPDNPLRAEVRIQTSEPTPVAVEVRGPDGTGFRVTPPDPVVDGDASVPLLGLRAGTTYDVSLRLGPGDDTRTVAAGRLETGQLATDLPPIDVATAATSDDALTLFDASPTPPPGQPAGPHHGYVVVVDGEGEVVWYEATEQPVQDVRRTDRGTLLFIYDETGARELLPTGELVREWSGTTALDHVPLDEAGRRIVTPEAIRVDTDQMHHEIVELPNGNLLTLSREVRTVEFPRAICDDEPFDGTYTIAGDVVVEFDPDTAEIHREISLFDVLDPLDDVDRLVPDEFCSAYLERRYPGDTPVRDWSHANAVVLDERRNALLVSVRHTDSVVAIRYSDDEHGPAGELLWELGPAGDLRLEGGGEWFLHQHAPRARPDGSILLYDNGNRRPGTSLEDPARLPYSRAVAYHIDPAAGTATQAAEYRFPTADGVYAPFVGDADDTGAGTVLITHGGLLEPLAHSPMIEGVVQHARLVEVDADTGEVRLDLRIRDPEGAEGWRVYRAERIPTLYPAGYRVVALG